MKNAFMKRRDFLMSTAVWVGLGSGALANAPDRSARPYRRGAEDESLTLSRPRARGEKPEPPPQPSLADIIEGWAQGGTASVALMDVETGALLDSYAPSVSTPPASTAKVLTTLYASDALGPLHRFETRVLATGPVVNGRLEGDLVLAGGGDPHLDTDAMADLVEQLVEVGVSSVSGRFLVYADALPQIEEIDPEQPNYVSYNPSLSGLNINFNRVYFQWRRASDGYSITMTAKSRNYNPAVTSAIMRIADRDTPVFAHQLRGEQERWSVARSALGREGSRWLPLRRPWACAGEVFRTLAAGKGLRMSKGQRLGNVPQGRVLARVYSSDFTAMSRAMLRYSTNLTAETLGVAASQARGKSVASLQSSAAEMNGWLAQRFGVDGAKLFDHSGLSDQSRVRADHMVEILRQSANSQTAAVLRKHAVGKRGEVTGVSVVAKTGTLNFVRGLAGYLKLKDGRMLAFAIYSANLKIRNNIPESQRERPRGAKGWANRAVRREQDILKRWAALYGS